MATNTDTATHIILVVRIYGKVQGVWYRAWAEQTAQHLGVAGWVRNRADQTVEAVLSGADAAVQAMIAACWQGPAKAEVTDIIISSYDDGVALQAAFPAPEYHPPFQGFRRLATV
jgi:acylphosphatase